MFGVQQIVIWQSASAGFDGYRCFGKRCMPLIVELAAVLGLCEGLTTQEAAQSRMCKQLQKTGRQVP